MRNIFRKTFFASLLALSLSDASAIPAYPGKISARQADGTEILIQRIGDEYCHITLTEDGYPLLFNSKSGNYEYATLISGKLVSSGIIATDSKNRNVAAQEFLAAVDKNMIMTQFSADCLKARESEGINHTASRKAMARGMRISDVPTTGKHDVLVILVQFANKKFSSGNNPAEYYDKFFHQEGFSENGAKGSVYDFYRYGSNYLYDPQFKVYGPVTLSGNYSDYAGGNQGTADTYKLIQEAVPLVNSQYDVDFSQFDTDGDGAVDNVYCIYAGYGQADSQDSNTIWPHSGNLSSVNRTDHTFKVDGVTIDRYTVSQELNGQTDKPVGIGTFVHEFGHVLGLADHYNTSSSTLTNQPGMWDVMASGSYNNQQNCPPTFSAFERCSLGWSSLTELNATASGIISTKPYEDTGEAYRISVADNESEYYIIENRQQKGWDTYLPGHGLLVWHIDEDQAVWDKNAVNAAQNHQRVDIVEASNVPTVAGSANDPFPGNKNVTAYDFWSWDKSKVFGFAWLQENADETAQFILSNSDYKLQAPDVEVTDITGTKACVKWKNGGIANGYSICVYHGDEVIAQTKAQGEGSFEVTGLEPETEYVAKTVSTVNSLSSDTVYVAFSTTTRQIEETTPIALPCEGYNGTSFTALWQPVKDADNYIVNLLTRTNDGMGTYGTGFDTYTANDSNLPNGWKLSEQRSAYSTYYGEKSPSVRLASDSAMLVACVPDYKISNVKFWHRASKTGIILSLDMYKDGKWTSVWTMNADRPRSLQENIDIDNADSVRLVLTRDVDVKNGYVFLDDVYLGYLYDQYHAESSATVAATESNTCRYTFSLLDPEKKYAYTVQACNGTRLSQVSNTVNVDITSGIEAAENGFKVSGKSKAVFNLAGIRITTVSDQGRLPDNMPKGIYIIDGKKFVIR